MNPWTLAALLAVLAFRTREGKVISKRAIRAGLAAGIVAKKSAIELMASAKESYADILAEIHEESLVEAASKKTTEAPESASSYE